MKLVLNLLLLLVAFALVRRALRRFFSPSSDPPPASRGRADEPPAGSQSGKHPAFPENEIIEDAEFEELD